MDTAHSWAKRQHQNVIDWKKDAVRAYFPVARGSASDLVA
jgi:hypothetical protein